MTIYSKREKFSGLSESVGKVFGQFPVSPNQWTLLTFIPAFLGLLAVYENHVVMAFVLFAITAFLDVVDGAVARFREQSTKFGAYLDAVVDRYVEFIIIASFLLLGLPYFILPAAAWIFLLLFGSMMSSFVKSASVEKNVVRAKGGHGSKGGLLEHSDRMIFFVLAFALYIFSPLYAAYLIVILAVLANVSALQRFSSAANPAKQ